MKGIKENKKRVRFITVCPFLNLQSRELPSIFILCDFPLFPKTSIPNLFHPLTLLVFLCFLFSLQSSLLQVIRPDGKILFFL